MCINKLFQKWKDPKFEQIEYGLLPYRAENHVGNTCIRQAGMHIDDQFIMVISVDKVAATIDAQCRQLSHLDVYSSPECIVLVPKQRAQSLSELEMPCIDHVFAMSDNRQ